MNLVFPPFGSHTTTIADLKGDEHISVEVGEHLLLELLDEDGVRPHEVLAGGQEVLRPDPHGGRVDPEAVPGAGHAQAHQQHQAGDQEKDGPKRSCHHIDHND